ncbi:MAG: flagellar basal body L-ring protein FlgH [Acidobacteriota bacterium]|nr:flagellar basal body L-ring protein FlgH [Acidobacteriota bacterium]
MKKAFLLLAALSTVGCLQKHGLVNNPYPEPAPIELHRPEPVVRAPGALFDSGGGTGSANLISDARAYRTNDIVIIQIAESMSATNSANTDLERTSTNSFKVPNLFGAEGSIGSVFGTSTDGTVLGTSTESEHEGRGTTARSDIFQGTVAARVIEVLPNGYLMIQGQKTVQVNDEKVKFYLTGMVNPLMIGSNHAVLSTQVADLQLRYGGNGVVTAEQNPGLFSRILKWLFPF